MGKIPGSYFRREARAGEKATLTARMIDRPLRPLFPKGWHYETQLVSTPLSVDHVHPYDILAMNGASAALAISPVPVAGVRRRGPDRQARRRLRRQPARGAARGPRDGPDRLRLQGRDPDGRVRRRRRHRGRGARRARHRPRRDQEARRRDGGAGREGRQGEARGRGPDDRRGAALRDPATRTASTIDEATRSPRSSPARTRSTRSRTRSSRSTRPTPATRRPTAPAAREVSAAFAHVREGHDPQADRRRQEASRRSRPGRDPSDRDRGRHLPPRARLGAVHPR